MLDRLEAIHQRYEELNQLLCDPEVLQDPAKLKLLSKEHADLETQNKHIWIYKSVIVAASRSQRDAK